jgi:branched-chain amino acid transport system substrate-binding protein
MVSANARRAASDRRTIAYIGRVQLGRERDLAADLNEAGILQVSRRHTAIGLTRGGLGTERGEPVKYTRRRPQLRRVVPNDRVQARAAGTLMRDAAA